MKMKIITTCDAKLCGKRIILTAEDIKIRKKKVVRHQQHRGRMAHGRGKAEAWIDTEYTTSRPVPLTT